MDIGLGSLIEKIEEYFGKGMASFLLFLAVILSAVEAIMKFIENRKIAKAAANQEQIVSEIKETFDLDARPWPVNLGAGRNVAQQIIKTETVQEARSIFNDHLVALVRKDSQWAVTAILHRLHEEGSNDEFMDLSMELYTDGYDISSPPEIEEDLGIRMRISDS